MPLQKRYKIQHHVWIAHIWMRPMLLRSSTPPSTNGSLPPSGQKRSERVRTTNHMKWVCSLEQLTSHCSGVMTMFSAAADEDSCAAAAPPSDAGPPVPGIADQLSLFPQFANVSASQVNKKELESGQWSAHLQTCNCK